MDAATRFEFFEFVRQQWGAERAGQLMDLLPPAGAAELATTDHLRAQTAELRGEVAELRVEVHDGFARLSDRMADQPRTIMLAMVTMWISGVALAVALVRVAS